MGPEHLTRHSSSLADPLAEDGGDEQPMADVQGSPPQESETVPSRRPALRRLVTDAVYDWYRASTGGGESRVLRQSPRYLAETFRQMLGSRPVYYLWCKDHETHEQLAVAPPDPTLEPPAQTRAAHAGSPSGTDGPRRSA